MIRNENFVMKLISKLFISTNEVIVRIFSHQGIYLVILAEGSHTR